MIKGMHAALLVCIVVCFAGCKDSSNSRIEGKYRKVNGSGTVFQNAFLLIEKNSNTDYRVAGLNQSETQEWQATARKSPEENKIEWTDKWLPMSITFEDGRAFYEAGNGSVGKFTFEKINQ